jgi:hypothetical protein
MFTSDTTRTLETEMAPTREKSLEPFVKGLIKLALNDLLNPDCIFIIITIQLVRTRTKKEDFVKFGYKTGVKQ